MRISARLPPSGDLYAIPGLEAYRSGVKLAFNVFLFDRKGSRRKWPKDGDGDRGGNRCRRADG